MIKKDTAYKNAMAQPLRNHSYMIVTIGAINQVAQKNAKCIGVYSYLSNLEKPFDSYDVEEPYATFENNLFKLDGTMFVPPTNSDYLLNNGIISQSLLGNISITFDVDYDIRGFTIFFGDNYPTSFKISNGTEEHTYSNDSSMFVCEDIYPNTKTLVFTPLEMKYGQNRFRINKIYMGVGITFENNKIQSSTFKEKTDSIASSLPQVDFSLKCENYNRMFDTENVNSAIHFLEIGQDVTWKYGYEVNENRTDWIDGGVAKLSSWSADDTKLEIKAKDSINDLTNKYLKGQYYENGISLYQLALDVLDDAGVDPRKYSIDTYLQTVFVNNPLPQKSHKECLQIIANCGRCKLYTDRQGIIKIVPNFVTVLNPDRMEVTSTDQTFYSSPKGVLKADSNYDYATFSNNHWRVDGSKYILPTNGDYLQTGFVSNEVSIFGETFEVDKGTLKLPEDYAEVEEDVIDLDTNKIEAEVSRRTLTMNDRYADAIFEHNPKFKIKLEAKQTFFGVHIDFDNNPAREMIIRTYLEGNVVNEFTEYNLELENYIEHEFSVFDEMEFEFVKCTPHSRIFVSRVSFGDVTDYYMSYNVLTDYPTGTIDKKTNKVGVVKYLYSKGVEEKNLVTQTVDLTGLSEYTIDLKKASSDLLVFDNQDNEEIALPILDYNTNSVTFRTSDLSGEHKITVKGKEYDITEKTISKTLEPSGDTIEWKNPLIGDDENADLVLEWIANYYSNNVTYDIQYRGEPRIEAEDIVFLENKYINNLQVQLDTHTIDFNGGALRGKATARRAINFSA